MMRSIFIVILLLSRDIIYADDHLLSFNNDNLVHQVQNIEHVLDQKNDLLDVQELKVILSKILVIIKDLALGKRSYTNIAYVHGLLSVNDEVVQNITATNLSATDEIISSSLKILPFNTAGVLHNNSSGLLSSSLIVNADVDAAAAIVDTKLATISTAGKVANSATTGTATNTPSTIVLRDASGNFSAGTITANLSGNATSATTATNFSGSLSGDVTGTQSATVVSTVGSQTAANVAAATVLANAATNINTANAIVKRDASGNFSAGTITANLSGNATTATNATNFTGSLSGDVTGTQATTVVSTVGGQTAANVAAATVLANDATSANTASTIVRRSAAGGFSTSSISVTDEVISSTLTITPLSTAGVVHNNASGLLSSSLIVNADVDPAAAIVDTKLATISTAGKVSNSATTATNANTASAIVTRDGTGSFAAQIISIVDAVSTGNLVFTGATSTSTTGNITKGGSRFIHNFGTNNTFVGVNAGNFTTSGTGGNTAIGVNALSANTTGQTCVAVGRNTLAAHTTGVSNVAVGDSALNATTTSNYNIGIGSNALLINTTGTRNVAVGDSALSTNVTGNNNVAMGKNALFSCTGSDNTAIGDNVGNAISTGSNNTAVGSGALSAVTTGTSNIALGLNAGNTITTTSNNIDIGNVGVAGDAAVIRIGTNGTHTTCFIQGIFGVNVTATSTTVRVNNTTGQLGTVASSQRFKHDIKTMIDESSNIFDLRPVTFAYNEDRTETMQYGLIAEEVDEVFPLLVVKDKDNVPFTVQYDVLPVLLLNEMKKQQATITDLSDKVEIMNAAISSLQSQMQEFIERRKDNERE